jgi:ribonuclease G
MTKDIVVSSTPQETKVALLEDGLVSEFFIERDRSRGIVGNLYKGRVTRVLPGMQSAFVDLGLERDAFLYVADVFEELDQTLTPEEQVEEAGTRRHAPIEERLDEGQEVLVQAVKEPLGTKGARITAHVSLPGRYLVFMPTVEHVGVSRKIVDDVERRRLRGILKELRDETGGGFIARTAGSGRSREDFERDARYLKRTWDEVRAVGSRERAPALLHRELSLVQRLVRDILSDDIAGISLDTDREFQRTLEMVTQLQPELAPRVRLFTKPQNILEEHGVSSELERALRSKVWLASGGYIVINQTEALVAIDVNTGRYIGNNKRLEDTILDTNLEAVKEAVRQIRLRDLGGIVVVDFIDMEERKSRQKVMSALEQELKKDRAPSKVISVNEFGLVILTRKRVKQSLERILCQPCPYCTGSGMIKSVATVCSEIYDEVRKLAAEIKGQPLVLRVNPEVARGLAGDEAAVLRDLQSLVGRDVTVQGDPLLHQEQFDLVPM